MNAFQINEFASRVTRGIGFSGGVKICLEISFSHEWEKSAMTHIHIQLYFHLAFEFGQSNLIEFGLSKIKPLSNLSYKSLSNLRDHSYIVGSRGASQLGGIF